MNKLIFSLGIIVVGIAAFANQQPTNVAQIIERESGGMITTTFKNTKKIYFVNAQRRAGNELLEKARQAMDITLKTPIDMTEGTFDFASPKIHGELSLYIIDDDKLPMSLIAPEGRWAFVNVSHLAKGRGESKAFFEARVRKEIARIGCMLFGNIGSSYNTNILFFVGDAEGLDRFESDTLPVDGTMRCAKYLQHLGVKPYRRISYRKACVEGWAPAPTNDIQKAIWNKVREDKERGPTNALQIKP